MKIGIIVGIIVVVFIIVAILCIIDRKKNKKTVEKWEEVEETWYFPKNHSESQKTITEIKNVYVKKTRYITECEKKYFDKLNNVLKNTNYVCFPQINLATIIDKTENKWYRNELFHNIDFGIFKANTFEPLVLIEINDRTHRQYKRMDRDEKVNQICQEADLPLITLYTNQPNEEWYIRNLLKQYIHV